MDQEPTRGAVATRPWFRLRPGGAAGTAALLFVTIWVLQWFVDGSGQAVVMLDLLPIALLAVTFGLGGGVSAAAVAFGTFSLFEVFHASGDIDVEGWVVRALAFFLLGALLGRATDEMEANRRSALEEQARRCRLEIAVRRYADAMEISDSIIQQLAAAKWLAETGHADRVADLLGETIIRGEDMVAGLLARRLSPDRVEFEAT